MALPPDEFYQHSLAAADSEHRLPLAPTAGWDISPFEPDGLRVAPLRPPVIPEPERHGEDPSNCDPCRARDEGIWFNENWRLDRIEKVGVPLVLMLHPRDHYDLTDLPDELAAELGLLSTRIVRHLQALPHIARAHFYRIGDHDAHLQSGSSPGPRDRLSCQDRGCRSGTTFFPSTPPTWPTPTPRSWPTH